MSSDSNTHKVGLIPVTLMVSGNVMGSGIRLLSANLAATDGITIYGWLITIIGSLGGSYAPRLSNERAVLRRACWLGNITMVVIGVGYLSYFFSILKDPLVLTLTCIAMLWIVVLLNIVGLK